MSDEFLVVVTDDWREPTRDFEMGLDQLYQADGIRVEFRLDRPTEQLRPSDLAGADAAIVGAKDFVTDESLEGLDRLRIMVRLGAGFDNYDLDAMTRHNVIAVHAPQGPTESVAQATVGMVIACAHRFTRYNRLIHEQGFEGRFPNMGIELAGKTLGIVGFGRIGQAVYEKMSGFDLDIMVHDPYADPDDLPADVRLGGLEELLETADFVTLHVPLTESTRGMLDLESFRLMKDSAYLINTTRGGIYADETLAAAIKNGEIAGAAIDVFEDEPDVEENPLLDLEDCLLTPHISGITIDSLTRIGEISASAILAVYNGEYPENILNPGVYDEPVPDKYLSPSYRP